MNVKLCRLMLVPIAIVILCGLAMALSWNTPSYAGGPEATPSCPSCTGGMNPTPVPNTSSIVGYVYDYTSGSPVPIKDLGVELSGCSWSAVWGTDDNGYFFFDNLGEGPAYVNLILPPNGRAINPNVLVNTSGVTQTYTVYMGFYLGDQPPLGELKTPDGRTLTGINEQTVVEEPASMDGAVMPDVGGTLPDSYLIIGLSAVLLVSLPMAGLSRLARQRARC